MSSPKKYDGLKNIFDISNMLLSMVRSFHPDQMVMTRWGEITTAALGVEDIIDDHKRETKRRQTKRGP